MGPSGWCEQLNGKGAPILCGSWLRSPSKVLADAGTPGNPGCGHIFHTLIHAMTNPTMMTTWRRGKWRHGEMTRAFPCPDTSSGTELEYIRIGVQDFVFFFNEFSKLSCSTWVNVLNYIKYIYKLYINHMSAYKLYICYISTDLSIHHLNTTQLPT